MMRKQSHPNGFRTKERLDVFKKKRCIGLFQKYVFKMATTVEFMKYNLSHEVRKCNDELHAWPAYLCSILFLKHFYINIQPSLFSSVAARIGTTKGKRTFCIVRHGKWNIFFFAKASFRRVTVRFVQKIVINLINLMKKIPRTIV